MKMKVFLVAGARPNFMKIAPIYTQMEAMPDHFEPMIVHTGQHYDANMSKVFFEDLALPKPHVYLGIGSGSHAQQTAAVMTRFEPELKRHSPDAVVLVGDVNSTIACALTALKCRLESRTLVAFRRRLADYLDQQKDQYSLQPAHLQRIPPTDVPLLVHVEAGERSYDFGMPEEINRIGTDIFSDILFTTSHDSEAHLLDEGVDPRKIFCVGNVMIDAMQIHLAQAEASDVLKKLLAQPKKFALVTLHRPGNVDCSTSLRMLLSALIRVSELIQIVFPMHPRTHKLMSELGDSFIQKVTESRINIVSPLSYLDFLHAQSNARLVLTDSGGVQVESSYLGIPCLTLRPNTEWQITLREGTNQLVPLNEDQIVQTVKQALDSDDAPRLRIKYWDGRSAERIVKVLYDIFLSV